MTGIQLPILASEGSIQHPYLWNHWCCSCLGHRLTHRWAVGSGHHTVLLADLKACGGLSSFEEKVLHERRWKGHMVNSLSLAKEEPGGSTPSTQDVPRQLHHTEHCRYPHQPSQTRISDSSLALCMDSQKDKEGDNYSCTRLWLGELKPLQYVLLLTQRIPLCFEVHSLKWWTSFPLGKNTWFFKIWNRHHTPSFSKYSIMRPQRSINDVLYPSSFRWQSCLL